MGGAEICSWTCGRQNRQKQKEYSSLILLLQFPLQDKYHTINCLWLRDGLTQLYSDFWGSEIVNSERTKSRRSKESEELHAHSFISTIKNNFHANIKQQTAESARLAGWFYSWTSTNRYRQSNLAQSLLTQNTHRLTGHSVLAGKWYLGVYGNREQKRNISTYVSAFVTQ